MSLKRSSDSKPSKDPAAKQATYQAVEESIPTWVAKDKEHTDKAMNYDWPFNINSTLRIDLHPSPTRNFLRIRAVSAKDSFSAFFRLTDELN